MANEITITAKLRVIKSEIDIEHKVVGDQFTLTGDAYDARILSIATTAAGVAITFAASIGTPGWAFAKNHDSTNYVDLGVQVGGTFYPFIKLPAGATTLFYFGTSTPYARANTAAVNLELVAVEV